MRSLLLQCADGLPYREMLRVTHDRHSRYAARWGMSFWWMLGKRERIHSWDKFRWAFEALRAGYDYVMYLDADAVIVNCEQEPTAATYRPGFGLAQSQVPGGEPVHLQAGVFYLRNGAGVPEMLAELLRRQPPIYEPLPLWWEDEQNEQTILNRMAQESPWGQFFHIVDYRWNVISNHERGTSPVVLHLAGTVGLENRLQALRQVCMGG